MPDISVQFHAEPRELTRFVEDIVAQYNLHVVMISFPPLHAEPISPCDIPVVLAHLSRSTELCFTLEPPNVSTNGTLSYRELNPDALRLNIGRYDGRTLGESHLCARTTNVAAIHIWRKIARKLKAQTVAGATAKNLKTGATGPARWARFTKGAVELHQSGVQLLTVPAVMLIPPVLRKPK